MYPHHYIQAAPLHVSTPLPSSYTTPCIHTTTFKQSHSMYPHHYIQAIPLHVSTPLHSSYPTPCIHTTTFKLHHFDMYAHTHVHTYVFPKEVFTYTCTYCMYFHLLFIAQCTGVEVQYLPRPLQQYFQQFTCCGHLLLLFGPLAASVHEGHWEEHKLCNCCSKQSEF